MGLEAVIPRGPCDLDVATRTGHETPRKIDKTGRKDKRVFAGFVCRVKIRRAESAMFCAGIECCRGCLKEGILSPEWEYHPEKGWLCPQCKTGAGSKLIRGISPQDVEKKIAGNG